MKILRNVLNAIMLVGTFLFLQSCATVYPLDYQKTQINVDGKPTDWATPLPFHDDATQLRYNITNDAQNLYLCLQATDKQIQTQITQGGFNLFLDPTGGKKQTTAITYPLPQQLTANPRKRNYQNQGTQQGESRNQDQPRRQQNQMLLRGFNNIPNGMSPLQSSQGIQVAISHDSTGTLIYEALIPLKTFLPDSATIANANNTISIGFSINPFFSPVAGGMRSAPRPRFSIGIGAPGIGFGMRPAMGGTRRGNSISQSKSSWRKVKINSPKSSS